MLVQLPVGMLRDVSSTMFVYSNNVNGVLGGKSLNDILLFNLAILHLCCESCTVLCIAYIEAFIQ